MPNPLFNQMPAQPPMPMNPMQRMNMVMQAMRNPVAFIRQAFPDIPEGIQNDPNQILGYLQQTRGITDQQIQQIQAQIPKV